MTKKGKDLKPAIYEFLKNLKNETAMAKLETMGISSTNGLKSKNAMQKPTLKEHS